MNYREQIGDIKENPISGLSFPRAESKQREVLTVEEIKQLYEVLSREDLEAVAAEVRRFILEKLSPVGGHLASSLGAVELLTAIHYVFDTPSDRLVLDVGHQGYPHKMLTGRRDGFDRIGKADGIAKFLSYNFV